MSGWKSFHIAKQNMVPRAKLPSVHSLFFFFSLSLSAPNPAALRMRAQALEKSSTAFLKEWKRSQTLQGSIYVG